MEQVHEGLGQPPAVPTPATVALPARRRGRWRRWLIGLLAIVFWIVGGALLVAHFGGFSYEPASRAVFRVAAEEPPTAKELTRLERKLQGMAPRSNFIVVDTVENRLQLRKGDEILRDSVCSAGTGARLVDPKSGREWIFDTPRGLRKVREKRTNPVWTKPEWAFIEEGEDLPTNWSDRIDADTLGAYALYLGDGYMIHGTLYQRYLGRSVTHGCIRLGDDDLEFVFKNSPLGTPVLLF
ncbi:MAG: L,D-transpeptidase [Acidobacteria bacterium]|nr:L,D-transpeptidase [Acidobacteriota bacterium]